MERLSQSPTDPAFVQDPYPFYARARAAGHFVHWEDYGVPCAVSHAAVTACLKDRRLGREAPPERAETPPAHLQTFYRIEANSMLELEPPRHTRLRRLVLKAFTSRAIAALAPEIEALAMGLIAAMPGDRPSDLLDTFARPLPVTVIARLLGVPDGAAPDLLRWSNAMVAMYQARRTRAEEDAAERATAEFIDFLSDHLARRRKAPGDDLLSRLIAADDDGETLSNDELLATAILLLNAGHEATVHSLGNGLKLLVETGTHDVTEATVEELLRLDPPLHIFQRWVYEDVEICGTRFARGDRISCVLGSANRDAAAYPDPDRFDPGRHGPAHVAFGAGLHFCVGAPLARLELLIGLRALRRHLPGLRLAEAPRYADIYHFHGLERLMVLPGPMA